MTFDRNGRLFVSSDASGEIYVVVKDAVVGGGNETTNARTAVDARSALPEKAFVPAVRK